MHFEYRGVKIYYDVVGKGSPILLVHGWGGSRQSLQPLAQLLCKKHKTIIVDLPGFGQSDTPPPTWGTPEYADVLVALLDELKISKINYFGHSFGGSLGIYLAVTTNKINKLVLCNSSYKRRQHRSPLVRFAHHILPSYRSPLKRVLYRMFFRGSDLARYPHLEQNFRNIMKYDLSPMVDKVGAPTLIIWGAEDTVTPVALAHNLHQGIKNSKLIVIPNTRHALPISEPQLLVDPIEQFL